MLKERLIKDSLNLFLFEFVFVELFLASEEDKGFTEIKIADLFVVWNYLDLFWVLPDEKGALRIKCY